jgi:hypothetical protein
MGQQFRIISRKATLCTNLALFPAGYILDTALYSTYFAMLYNKKSFKSEEGRRRNNSLTVIFFPITEKKLPWILIYRYTYCRYSSIIMVNNVADGVPS